MARRPRHSAAENKRTIIDAASELFYAEGIRSVGVERIARSADVAPPTLYRAFASKDDLIVAYIEQRDQAWRSWFREIVEAARTPEESISAVFEAALAQVQTPHYRGCPFQMALAEFPATDHPAHLAAVANKEWMRTQFAELCANLGAPSTTGMADQFCVLLDGLYVSAQSLGPAGYASTVTDIVPQLLEAAGRDGQPE
ncbi:TetR/AcrR family transcriptional regulator [Ilumatobacter sp.]|uniref:TetR/AcrR family transcriptional regulator n=1 Tax=Ilumatobacter sp. TaxID=1967498 RepID=UPI003B529079